MHCRFEVANTRVITNTLHSLNIGHSPRSVGCGVGVHLRAGSVSEFCCSLSQAYLLLVKRAVCSNTISYYVSLRGRVFGSSVNKKKRSHSIECRRLKRFKLLLWAFDFFTCIFKSCMFSLLINK